MQKVRAKIKKHFYLIFCFAFSDLCEIFCCRNSKIEIIIRGGKNQVKHENCGCRTVFAGVQWRQCSG